METRCSIRQSELSGDPENTCPRFLFADATLMAHKGTITLAGCANEVMKVCRVSYLSTDIVFYYYCVYEVNSLEGNIRVLCR